MSYNPIPGYSIIGRGYNIFGKLIPSPDSTLDLRPPCYDVGDIETKTYKHNDTIYSVPDNIQVDEGDKSEIKNNYGKSIEKYLASLSSDVSISEGYGLFSGELKVAFNGEISNEKESWFSTTSSSVNLFSLSLTPEAPLSGDLLEALVGLSQINFLENPYPFFEFFETFGTHYIDSLVLGGNVYLDCISSDNTVTDDMTITTNLSAAYGAVFNIDGNASWNQVNTSVFSNTNISLRSEGGSIEITENITPGTVLTDVYSNWHKSLDNHAVPVGVTYKEIYTLIEDNVLRGSLKVAYNNYLSNKLEIIYKTSSYTSNTFDIQLNGNLIEKNSGSSTGVQIVAIDRTKNDLPIFWNRVYGLDNAKPMNYWDEIYTDLKEHEIVGNNDYIVILVTYGSFPLDQVPEGEFIDYLISLGADLTQHKSGVWPTLGSWFSAAKSSSSDSQISYAIAGIYNSSTTAEFYDYVGNSSFGGLATLNLFIQPNVNEISNGKISFDLVDLGISNS